MKARKPFKAGNLENIWVFGWLYKMIQSFRNRKFTAFHKLLGLLIIVLLFLLVQLDYLTFGRTTFSGSQRCPTPARFHLSAEPELYPIWDSADAYLISGGHNLFPGKAGFNPTLIGGCCQEKIFERRPNHDAGFKPIASRTFADVLYRSSNCQGRREMLAGLVRRKVEAAGFTFKATGLCGGEGYPQKVNFTGRGEWTKCGRECTDSKIMLAFERFQKGYHYLGEKLFTPLEHGTIPAYFGNGHSILDMLTVNRRAFIDRFEFRSDESFADYIVELLRHPEVLQKMQEEPVFSNPEMAKKRALFMVRVENSTREGNPELYHALRDNPKFKKFINASNVKYRAFGINPIRVPKHILNITSLVHVRDPEACVELEVYGCCP